MTDNLRTKLVSVLTEAGISVLQSEAETDVYPYATFDLPVEYQYTKDGLYKIVGVLTIRVVSDDVDEADALHEDVMEAIAEGFSGLSSLVQDDAQEVDDDSESDPGEVTEIVDTPTVEAVASETPEEPDEPADGAVSENPDDPNEEIDSADDDVPVDTCTYTAQLTDVLKDCTDGVWVIEMDYILNQYE